ncbi:MAG TPA: DUF4236 domain-containing protein, partial [Candidatus Thermoplasmatota archaeon]|nr:DUF4236 domain-containing protein [Candidatus Thermoplasmatota archaeon]
GLRFGKRISLGKGVRLNISKSGVGISAGTRGGRISVGPRGARASVGVPGSGLRYEKRLGGAGAKRAQKQASASTVAAEVKAPLFASRVEKEFVRGINAYQRADRGEALAHLRPILHEDLGPCLLACSILYNTDETGADLLPALERVVLSEEPLPRALHDKYLSKATMEFRVTEFTRASVPMDEFGAALVLAEVYQKLGRTADAIGLLEELDEADADPVVRLSLCDLYAATGQWDGVLERAQGATSEDDVTLELVILHARALAAKGLHEAAIPRFGEALRRKKGREGDLLKEAAYWRAVSYESSGKKAQARKEFEKLYGSDAHWRDVAARVSPPPAAGPGA